MTTAAELASYASSFPSFRNRIINGDMRIDQRNGGVSVTPSNSLYTLDRWQLSISVGPKLSVQQSSTSPDGFNNSSLISVVSAHTSGVDQYASFCTKIEGFDSADFGFGTANAKTITLSFWVRSSLTGTFSGSFQNSAANRSYPFTFTINLADTFEYKTVTVVGETSGTWDTTNGKGIEVHFDLGSGSNRRGTAGAWNSNWNTGATGAVSLLQTNGATFYITGVQLEEGTVATPFEHRPYGMELALCQRYFYKFDTTDLDDALYFKSPYATGTPPNTTASVAHFHPVTMRASPDIIATVNGGTLNRKTSNNKVVVFQMATTSINNAYNVTLYTADAEL